MKTHIKALHLTAILLYSMVAGKLDHYLRKKIMKNQVVHLMIFVFAVSFFACNESAIVHDLNERDANEILVLLTKNDIVAFKEKEVRSQEIYWIIKVAKVDQMRAQSILVANNLPKIRQGGLRGICEDTSMIVTEATEKCRQLLAYKGEIINSLESIPGVVSADVVLNIPDKEEFASENTPALRPTAAVTVKYLTDANVKTKLTEGKIQSFVANSIAGLDSRDVSVIISLLEQKLKEPVVKEKGDKQSETGDLSQNKNGEVQTTSDLVSVLGIMMDQRSAKKFKIISAVFLVLLLLLSSAFIYALLRMSKLRKQSSVEATPETDLDEEDNKLLEA